MKVIDFINSFAYDECYLQRDIEISLHDNLGEFVSSEKNIEVILGEKTALVKVTLK